MTTFHVVAIAPVSGTAFVEHAGAVFLVAPPYRRLMEASVDDVFSALERQGFEGADETFERVTGLISHLRQRGRASLPVDVGDLRADMIEALTPEDVERIVRLAEPRDRALLGQIRRAPVVSGDNRLRSLVDERLATIEWAGAGEAGSERDIVQLLQGKAPFGVPPAREVA